MQSIKTKLSIIGALQDRLLTIGCFYGNDNKKPLLINFSRMYVTNIHEIVFWLDFAFFRGKIYYYSNNKFMQNLIKKVIKTQIVYKENYANN